MKKDERRPGRDEAARGGEADALARQLAPPEERARAGGARRNHNGGAIVLDTGALKLPEGLVEAEEKQARLLGLEPVVIVILAVMLAFTAFIAWQITRMRRPTANPPAAEAQRQG
jgi:hypothetical protein